MLTYREVLAAGERTFHLDGDLLTIRGRTPLRSSFETTVRLAEADPHPTLLWIRPRLFFLLVGLALLFAIASLVATASGVATERNMADLIMWCAAGLMLVLSSRCFRKVRFTQFRNRSGVVLFDVAQSGPDRARYDAFIAAIRQAMPGVPAPG